jgi:hypothetical protein
MSELKTQKNDASVTDFLGSVENESRREDSKRILALMTEVTGEEPVMWGDSIVGFGEYKYKYASGREGEWMLVGFSPRFAFDGEILLIVRARVGESPGASPFGFASGCCT